MQIIRKRIELNNGNEWNAGIVNKQLSYQDEIWDDADAV